jgi:hypothetical protein
MPVVNVTEDTMDKIEQCMDTYRLDVSKRAIVDESVEQFLEKRQSEIQ